MKNNLDRELISPKSVVVFPLSGLNNNSSSLRAVSLNLFPHKQIEIMKLASTPRNQNYCKLRFGE
jgi:hypothetical protein